MALEESISLEETNKIRIKLGLKPLVDDNAPTDTKEKEANDNFAARKEEEDKAKRARYVHEYPIRDFHSYIGPLFVIAANLYLGSKSQNL